MSFNRLMESIKKDAEKGDKKLIVLNENYKMGVFQDGRLLAVGELEKNKSLDEIILDFFFSPDN